MTPLDQLPAWERQTGSVNAIIDTPKSSRAKYKYDGKSGQFRLSKLLPLGAFFPYNFGFIPSTRGEDGDALDILVIMDEPVSVGTIVPVKLIGVLEGEQQEKGRGKFRNDRLIGVLSTALNPPPIHSLDEMDKQQLDELEHFFVSYNQIEGRQFTPLERGGLDKAEALIKEGMRRHDVSAKAA